MPLVVGELMLNGDNLVVNEGENENTLGNIVTLHSFIKLEMSSIVVISINQHFHFVN